MIRRVAAGAAVVLAATAVAVSIGTGPAAAAGPAIRPPDRASAAVITAARHRLGAKYQWGGTGPAYDCSGLTQLLWRRAGRVAGMPRTAAQQQAWAIPVPATQVLPGDLIFFGRPAGHVGLVLNRQWMIDAASSVGRVVVRRVWPGEVISYGRVPRPHMPPVRRVPAHRPAKPAPPARYRTAVVWDRGLLVPVPGRAGFVRPIGRAPYGRMASIAYAHRGARFVWNGHGPGYDDVTLILDSYYAAGGRRVLPRTRARLGAAAHTVPGWQLRSGDLVVYGGSHLGIYLSRGYMVDASLSHRRIVVRRVYWQPGVRFGRLGG